MIRISRLTDYGIVLLTHMAAHAERVHNATEVAAEAHLPLPTVSKLLRLLTKEGLLAVAARRERRLRPGARAGGHHRRQRHRRPRGADRHHHLHLDGPRRLRARDASARCAATGI